MNIAIGCDHAGIELKNKIMKRFSEHNFTDEGCFSQERVDYPDYAKKVCNKVIKNECECGILICGTGIGMSIAANKIHGIRAGLALNEMMAEFSRLHNNANILALGARVTGDELAFRMVDVFFKTDFEGNRHQNRLDKIKNINL